MTISHDCVTRSLDLTEHVRGGRCARGEARVRTGRVSRRGHRTSGTPAAVSRTCTWTPGLQAVGLQTQHWDQFYWVLVAAAVKAKGMNGI